MSFARTDSALPALVLLLIRSTSGRAPPFSPRWLPVCRSFQATPKSTKSSRSSGARCSHSSMCALRLHPFSADTRMPALQTHGHADSAELAGLGADAGQQAVVPEVATGRLAQVVARNGRARPAPAEQHAADRSRAAHLWSVPFFLFACVLFPTPIRAQAEIQQGSFNPSSALRLACSQIGLEASLLPPSFFFAEPKLARSSASPFASRSPPLALVQLMGFFDDPPGGSLGLFFFPSAIRSSGFSSWPRCRSRSIIALLAGAGARARAPLARSTRFGRRDARQSRRTDGPARRGPDGFSHALNASLPLCLHPNSRLCDMSCPPHL